MSVGIMVAASVTEGIPGTGNTGPRVYASNENTAAINIQQVKTNGEVEAGDLIWG